MSKQKRERVLAKNEAKAVLSSVKGSVQKAGLVLDLIRNKPVETALNELMFSRRKLSGDARKLLESAIANAENNHDLNVDKLFVKETWANKNVVLKRWRARARGRVGKILKPRCNMTIVVAERLPEPVAKAAPKETVKKEAKA